MYVVEDGLSLGPILDGRLPNRAREFGGLRREAGPIQTRRDQRERRDPIGVVEREVLRDPAAHRASDDVRAADSKDVEDSHSVRDEVLPAVRSTRLVADRLPGVAQVVRDHEP